MFAKVFKSLYYGSMLGKQTEQSVFICLLAHCDRDGNGELPAAVISTLTGINEDDVRLALEALSQADPDSRIKVDSGKRIMLHGNGFGYSVVNYEHYRGMRDEEDRREQTRRAMRKLRHERSAKVSQGEPDVSQGEPPLAQAEAEEEAEVEADEDNTTCAERCSAPPAARLPTNRSGEFYSVTKDEIERLQALYPAVSVVQAVRSIRGWLEANPVKRKTLRGMPRFINAWMSREQDRARPVIQQEDVNKSPAEGERLGGLVYWRGGWRNEEMAEHLGWKDRS